MEDFFIIIFTFIFGLALLIWLKVKPARTPSYVSKCNRSLIREEFLMKLAKKLGREWKNIGRSLGIESKKLEQLDIDHRGYVTEAICQVLITWRNENGKEATLTVLRKVLQENGRTDLAEWISSQPTSTIRDRSNSDEGSSLTLSQLQESLRRRYRAFIMRGLPWMGNVVLSLKEHFVELEIIKENRNTPNHLKEKVKLEHMFESHGEKASKILVEGYPGFGKTTLAAKLCFDFATEENYIRQFDLVLLFALRNFGGSLEEMLLSAAGICEQQCDCLLDILRDKSVRILLILDGFDELPERYYNSVLPLICGDEFSHFTIVMTSRPGKFTSNAVTQPSSNISRDLGYNMAMAWDKHVKAVGITEERQAEFITKHLSDFSTHVKQHINEQLGRIKKMNIMTPDFLKCPLFMLMILLLLTNQDSTNLPEVKTKTQVYKGVMNFVMGRYMSKTEKSFLYKLISRFFNCVRNLLLRKAPHSKLSLDLFCLDSARMSLSAKLMKQFGEFALTAINDNSLLFSQEYILGPNSKRDKRIMDLGILTKTVSVNGFRETVCYEPVHKSLIEFAAAYYLWAEFIHGKHCQWKKNILMLQPISANKSSLLFPFLVGLMGNEAAAIFDTLRPYAAEYSSVFDPLIPSLWEMKMSDSILSSLIPFLPQNWQTYRSTSLLSFNSLRPEAMNEGVRVGRIKTIVWDLYYSVNFSQDVSVDKLDLLVPHTLSELRDSHFRKIRCNHLMCQFGEQKGLGDEWKTFLDLLSRIQFEHISFMFHNPDMTLEYIPLLHEALTEGQLRNADIHWVKCFFDETNIGVVGNMMNDLLQIEKLDALVIHLHLSSHHLLENLFESIYNSKRLNQLVLSAYGFSIDLAQVFGGGLKAYKRLTFRGSAIIKCSEEMKNQDVQIDLLEWDTWTVPSAVCITNLLQTCRVKSFYGPSSMLSLDSPSLHQSIIELNIKLDETFFEKQLFHCLSRYTNLEILSLKLPFDIQKSVSVDEWLLEPIQGLHSLRRIDINGLRESFELANEIIEGFAQNLERSSTVSSVTETDLPVASKPKSCSVECLQIEYSAYFGRDKATTSPNEDDITKFLHILLRLKQCMIKEALPILEIIVSRTSIEDLSRYHPEGFYSFVELFSPEENFVVQHDRIGMKTEDSIRNKAHCNEFWRQTHRFSVSLQKDRNMTKLIF